MVEIRRFECGDAEACHRMRREAFVQVFSALLSPQEVELGIESVDTAGFGRTIGGMDTFVAVMDGKPAGFCTVRFPQDGIAEILYLYVHLRHVGEGIGSALARHAEDWIRRDHPGVTTIVLDTAVPSYNLEFWVKQGYRAVGRSVCRYPGGDVRATRMRKDTGESEVARDLH
jgi:GNAT superfamily N-acetyltransferase